MFVTTKDLLFTDSWGYNMQERIEALWDQCLSHLSREVNRQAFHTWLKPTSVEYVDDHTFNILVPNNFAASRISERFTAKIRQALAAASEVSWDFGFKVKQMPVQSDIFHLGNNGNGQGSNGNHGYNPDPEVYSLEVKSNNNGSKNGCRLNPRYVFDKFIVGDSNEFAYAACEAVSEALGVNRYNPLFIYGGVGLGKTHLVQAIGNAVLETDPRKKIMYVTSEEFTNDFIRSLGTKSTHEFVTRYRTVDLLLLDDIQFFTGKESTQEQFFHTFNALHQDGKQIVLTADRPPADILGLEERLLSRFNWGLVADIQPPSLETRIAILQKKAALEEVYVPDDVFTYVADSIKTNVRELEGALTALIAYSALKNEGISLAMAKSRLKNTIRDKKSPVTLELISKKVSSYFKVSEELIKSKKKSQEVVIARQVAMHIARNLTNNSLKVIGKFFGNRDHSTVIHAVQQVNDMCSSSQDFKLQVDQLTADMYGG